MSFNKWAVLFSLLIVGLAEAKPPSIDELPRLRPGLPVGSIAWATPDQLHPTQPQTGKREVQRKTERFIGLQKKDGASFSQDLYELAFEKSISPVYIGPVPANDHRAGRHAFLGYITDRTHGANAQSEMIRQVYGEAALSQPIYDKKGTSTELHSGASDGGSFQSECSRVPR